MDFFGNKIAQFEWFTKDDIFFGNKIVDDHFIFNFSLFYINIEELKIIKLYISVMINKILENFFNRSQNCIFM